MGIFTVNKESFLRAAVIYHLWKYGQAAWPSVSSPADRTDLSTEDSVNSYLSGTNLSWERHSFHPIWSPYFPTYSSLKYGMTIITIILRFVELYQMKYIKWNRIELTAQGSTTSRRMKKVHHPTHSPVMLKCHVSDPSVALNYLRSWQQPSSNSRDNSRWPGSQVKTSLLTTGKSVGSPYSLNSNYT